jgi:hypothetical protein
MKRNNMDEKLVLGINYFKLRSCTNDQGTLARIQIFNRAFVRQRMVKIAVLAIDARYLNKVVSQNLFPDLLHLANFGKGFFRICG